MPPRLSFATFLFSAIAAAAAASQPQPLAVMPAPSEVRVSEGRIAVAGGLSADVSGVPSARLQAAISRAAVRWAARIGTQPAQAGASPTRVLIECSEPGAEFPQPTEDESYSLQTGPSGITLRARSALGAMHGLETLLQLVQRDASGWFLPVVSIADQPRFGWRGLLIDVARHWEPVEVIERNLDAMAVVKLNVLHFHLTDDQGFRIESLTHPELQAKGSDGMYYTQEQMRGLIRYAAQRGIRVVPEFDVPGHATSWVVSHPELASLPGPYGIERHWGVFDPVLDPTNEATYALLSDFLGEMSALFPDPYIHIGGDENNGVQWSANPRIQAFIRDHGLKDNEGLHTYFNSRIEKILAAKGKKLAGWDEILQPGLPKACMIESWRGVQALASAAESGYDGILANGFYVDLIQPAAQHYAADPIPTGSTLTPAQRAHILGGEATMWGEWVTPETIDSRIWPRTAAVAERLWSAQSVRDVDDMYRRLSVVGSRLEEAGSLHRRNQDLMLRHLVGENLKVAGVESLRTFISIIEPVKGYQRGGLQVWSNQQVPLVYIADAAQPESEACRDLALAVDRMLFSGPGIKKDEAAPIAATLARWNAAGQEVLGSMIPIYPALREAEPNLRSLAASCTVATAALESIESGRPLSSAGLASDLKTLDLACEPSPSATELPSIATVRLLAEAAALQGERTGLSVEAWRAKVAAAAH